MKIKLKQDKKVKEEIFIYAQLNIHFFLFFF